MSEEAVAWPEEAWAGAGDLMEPSLTQLQMMLKQIWSLESQVEVAVMEEQRVEKVLMVEEAWPGQHQD